MFHIPLSTKHHTISRDDCNLHRVIPSFLLFPILFHQSFLGRKSTRRSSRDEGIPQPRIGFPRSWNMDLHRRLHLVWIDTGSLHSGILWCPDDASSLCCANDSPGKVRSRRADLEFVVNRRHCRGIFVVRLDRAGKEGDLATWRAIPAKVCYSMVSSTLKVYAILPDPDVFSTNRRTIRRRYSFVFFISVEMVPMSFWIWTTEATLWIWGFVSIYDTQLSFGFGQVCF